MVIWCIKRRPQSGLSCTVISCIRTVSASKFSNPTDDWLLIHPSSLFFSFLFFSPRPSIANSFPKLQIFRRTPFEFLRLLLAISLNSLIVIIPMRVAFKIPLSLSFLLTNSCSQPTLHFSSLCINSIPSCLSQSEHLISSPSPPLSTWCRSLVMMPFETTK